MTRPRSPTVVEQQAASPNYIKTERCEVAMKADIIRTGIRFLLERQRPADADPRPIPYDVPALASSYALPALSSAAPDLSRSPRQAQ